MVPVLNISFSKFSDFKRFLRKSGKCDTATYLGDIPPSQAVITGYVSVPVLPERWCIALFSQ